MFVVCKSVWVFILQCWCCCKLCPPWGIMSLFKIATKKTISLFLQRIWFCIYTRWPITHPHPPQPPYIPELTHPDIFPILWHLTLCKSWLSYSSWHPLSTDPLTTDPSPTLIKSPWPLIMMRSYSFLARTASRSEAPLFFMSYRSLDVYI